MVFWDEGVLVAGVDEAWLRGLVDQLPMARKVALLSGQDSWSLHAVEEIGLRSIVMSDGPAGVRGSRWDERHPSVNFPSPTCLAASWDIQSIEWLGAALGREARDKDVDVVLGPTINIQRTPYGGRHFEAFSEDPLLSGVMAAAYIRGLQSQGVAATPKHYVGNESETQRFSMSSEIDEQTLREVYLLPFEYAVREGRAWALMSAYNSINGVTASEHELLSEPLKGEWAFDGAVVSDWTAIRSIDAAKAAQDIAMPGPETPWARALLAAVEAGEVDATLIDEKVVRILRLAARVGALYAGEAAAADRGTMAPSGDRDATTLARDLAVEGAVLLSNDGILPLVEPTSIAVIGEAATFPRTQGGGSATVIPQGVSVPLDAIRERWPNATVVSAVGARVDTALRELPLDRIRSHSGAPGMTVTYLAADGGVLGQEERAASRIVSFEGESHALRAHTIVMEFEYAPTQDGDLPLGVIGVGDFSVAVGGDVVGRGSLRLEPGADPASVVLHPPSTAVRLPRRATPSLVTVRLKTEAGNMPDAMSFGVGCPVHDPDPVELLEEAARAAASADVAVVLVSTSAAIESEGFDRTTLELPGHQRELLDVVVAANPRTVVIVNAGAPVIIPDVERFPAVIAAWFPGQEFGHALTAVLAGDREPGGRLPVTWPGDEETIPVTQVVPDDGKVVYAEGVHVGYRAWLRHGSRPAFTFGHGLGYTNWSLEEAEVLGNPSSDDCRVRVRIRNVGDRAGKAVVQAYLTPPDDAEDRPARWLAGFAVCRLAAGTSDEFMIDLPARAFSRWQDGWCLVHGTFGLGLGWSSADLPAQLEVDVRLA